MNEVCYCAHMGDSRAILSQHDSNKIVQLTKDHRPMQNEERIRLVTSGAYIYQ